MVELGDLWVPIVVSGVLVFVVSSLLHMLIPLHKGDYDRLPDEDRVLASLRDHGVGPGQYMFPRPSSMADLKTPEMAEKWRVGPVGTLIVRPRGGPAMGRALAAWFLYTLCVGFLVAYLATISVPRTVETSFVYRFVGTAAFLGYAVGPVVDSIWKGVRWGTSAKFVFDGAVYAVVTAFAFGWLWPT